MAVLAAVLVAAPLVARGGIAARVARSVAPPQGRGGAPDVSGGRPVSLDPYRGLGSWIDVYDSAWGHPRIAVRAMARRGVRTLYLQTSNFNRSRPFVFKDATATFLDAAAREGIRVVAWYLPGFRDVDLDARRSTAAIAFRTAAGNAFDSFALDIESPEVRRPRVRTARLLRLSDRLRRAAGETYPLGAIVPSPSALVYPRSYWPHFPFERLAETYDVFLPMTYFTWRVSGERGAHRYTARNIDIIRHQVGDRSAPIHVIGGIGGEAHPAETAGFVRAVRERGILGASWYTFPLTTAGDWRALEWVRPNPVQRPALPLGLPFEGEVGYVPGSDVSHPHEIVFRTGAVRSGAALRFEAFDVQPGEVAIYVNWRRLGSAPASAGPAWGEGGVRRIPGHLLNDRDPNYIAFVARGDVEVRTWGVRGVSLVRAP